METEFVDYVDKMKSIQNSILHFIVQKNKIEENYQNLKILIEEKNCLKSKEEIKSILYLISKISDNHHREADFFKKIEKILFFFSERIKELFTNDEILKIFKNNKRILLFLIKEKLIIFDDSFFRFLMEYKSRNYTFFFSPEIKSYLSEMPVLSDNEQSLMSASEKNEIIYENIPDDFDNKRMIGENDDEFYDLIRKDLIDQFKSCVDLKKIQLNQTINPSIFESNLFLLKKRKTKLIEYAAFFGSIQIFKYLFSEKVDITPDIWLYAIHGNNLEIIHFIEDNYKDKISYEQCFKEAIKCHHNILAYYIQLHYLNQTELDSKTNNNPDDNYYLYAFHYYNFSFFPIKSNNKFIYYYSCEYDYSELIELLLKSKCIDLNLTIQIFLKMIYRI